MAKEESLPLDIRGALAERKRIVAWLRSINERTPKAGCENHEVHTHGCSRCDGKRARIYYSHENASEIEKGEHVDCPPRPY